MSSEPNLRELLAPMTEREVELDAPAFQVDRARVLARMAQARSHERRAPLGYVAWAAAGIAVLVLGAQFVARHSPSAASGSLEILVSEGSARQLHGDAHAEVTRKQSTQIAASGELETAADSQAQVRTVDGLQIDLQSQTRVALAGLVPSTSQLTLLGGAIRCTVPHRAAAHAFRVVTSDATVVDLGTVFTVSIEGPNHTTRVSVEEGEVLVRHGSEQTRVLAPSSWSSAQPVPASNELELEPLPSASSDATPPPGARATRRSIKAIPSVTLEQEAQLLRQGLAAERKGQPADAIAALTQLLQKYPHSPLAPDARAALARVEAAVKQ